MNNIIKVILLNFILIYFLIKKNKSISMFLIVILFMYVLYLRGKNLLEGQSNIDEKKDEVKFMKMTNLDKLLDKLLNIYENSEQDCIGEYSDFSPCDKKCGITHKFKTYRIKKRAGAFGKSCVEEDGRRKKVLCDESDGVYKCIIGESCQEDGDCETNNCDPKTNQCVSKKVCSNTNLDLCNKEECIDLNNHYDYAKREFKYDEAESGIKCKLEDKKTDNNGNSNNNKSNNNNIGNDYNSTKISSEQCDSDENFWLYKDENREDTLTSVQCRLKISNSVYYDEDDDERLVQRNNIYGINNDDDNRMKSGLYCKIGYKFDDNADELKGVTIPILSNDLEGMNERTLSEKCNTLFTNGEYDSQSINDVPCKQGYWPPLNYFKELKNLNQNEDFKIPIGEMCKRCINGYKYFDNTENGSCTRCDILNNNQWIINSDNKYESTNTENLIGKNMNCIGGQLDTESESYTDSCNNLISNRYTCSNDRVLRENISSISNVLPVNFDTDCCTSCALNSKINGSQCEVCPPGQIFNPNDRTSCTPCPTNNVRAIDGANCIACPDGKIPNDNNSSCVLCPQNSIKSGSDTECTPCPDGKIGDSTRTSCILCSEGSIRVGDNTLECSTCPNRLNSNDLRTSCESHCSKQDITNYNYIPVPVDRPINLSDCLNKEQFGGPRPEYIVGLGLYQGYYCSASQLADNPNAVWGSTGSNLQYLYGGDYVLNPKPGCNDWDPDLRKNPGDDNSLDFYDECCYNPSCGEGKIYSLDNNSCTDCDDACSASGQYASRFRTSPYNEIESFQYICSCIPKVPPSTDCPIWEEGTGPDGNNVILLNITHYDGIYGTLKNNISNTGTGKLYIIYPKYLYNFEDRVVNNGILEHFCSTKTIEVFFENQNNIYKIPNIWYYDSDMFKEDMEDMNYYSDGLSYWNSLTEGDKSRIMKDLTTLINKCCQSANPKTTHQIQMATRSGWRINIL